VENMKKALSLICIIIIGIIVINCQNRKSNQTQNKPLIIVSVPPYISIVQAIAGDSVVVHSAIQPNFDPHTMEITPKQVVLIQKASLFIAIGEPFERKLCSALQKKGNILQLNEKIPTLYYTDSNASAKKWQDNHFWLSLKRLPVQVKFITDVLSRMNPNDSDMYRERANLYIEKIKKLDKKIEKDLYPYQKKALLVSHPALNYLCVDYGLEQIAVEWEGKSPLPKEISHIMNLAEKSNIVCAFTFSQFNNKGVKWIADKLNIHIENIDPLDRDPLKTIEKIVLFITKS